MTRTRQWYYDSALLGGETGKTVTVGAGQLDPELWECRTQVDYGSASVAALLGPIPILSSLSVAAQEGDGDVPLTYALNVNKIVHFVLSTGATKPTYAELSAGQESGGGAAPEAFSQYLVASASSLINAEIASTSLGDNYYIHAVIDGGADGDVITASGSPVFIDTTAPVLSSPSSSNLAATTADGSVTSDSDQGTLYAGVWPTASTPSAADIIAGTGPTYSTSNATPTAGVNNFSATGLTASTAYKWHFHQVDDNANASNIATSAEFTTTAAAGDNLVFTATLNQADNLNLSAETTAPLSLGAGSHVVVINSNSASGGVAAFSLTGANVSSATLLLKTTGGGSITGHTSVGPVHYGISIFYVVMSASGVVTITETAGIDSFNRKIFHAAATGLTTVGAIGKLTGTQDSAGGTAIIASVPQNAWVIGTAMTKNGLVTAHTWSGDVSDTDRVANSAHTEGDLWSSMVIKKKLTATSDFTLTVSYTGQDFTHYSGMNCIALLPA